MKIEKYCEGLDYARIGDFGYNTALRKATNGIHDLLGPFVGGEGDLLWFMPWTSIGTFLRQTRYVIGYCEVNMFDDDTVGVKFDARN